jgi:hypothetical protein
MMRSMYKEIVIMAKIPINLKNDFKFSNPRSRFCWLELVSAFWMFWEKLNRYKVGKKYKSAKSK